MMQPKTVLCDSVYVWQRKESKELKSALDDARVHGNPLYVFESEYSKAPNGAKSTKLFRRFDGILSGGQGNSKGHFSEAYLKDIRGLVIRIASIKGTFADSVHFLSAVREDICLKSASWSAQGTNRNLEIQIDFDAYPSQLKDYHAWLKSLKKCSHLPITFTAMISWINAKGFNELANEFQNFVMQVHYLHREKLKNLRLFDFAEVKSAILKLELMGVNFRVAFPFYYHDALVQNDSKIVGVESEGNLKYAASEVKRMAVGLPLADIAAARKELFSMPLLTDVLWFRLPLASDVNSPGRDLLWQLQRGEYHSSQSIVIEQNSKDHRLWDFYLRNSGEVKSLAPVNYVVKWQGNAKCEAMETGDAFSIRHASNLTAKKIIISTKGDLNLSKGERKYIGWIRLNRKANIEVKYDAAG